MTEPTQPLEVPTEVVQTGASQCAQAHAVLVAFERSLLKSQKALLAGDVAGLEEATAEQARLGRWFAELGIARLTGERSGSGRWPEAPPGAAGSLREIEERVLRLGQVQAAILKRIDRSTRALVHMVTGPAGAYDRCGRSVDPGSAARISEGKRGRMWRD